MSNKPEFAIAGMPVGRLNALVKILGGEDVANGIIDKELEFSVTKKVRLRLLGTTTLPARRKRYDPATFKREGRSIWDGFANNILAMAKPVKSVPKVTLERHLLKEEMTDAENREDLGDGHIFEDASVFVAILDFLLDRQKNGEDLDDGLLVNGYANIFYVRGLNGEVFAVYAHWGAGFRKWDVDAYPLVVSPWGAGRCVLRATAT